jgi:hypothetical protein
MLADARDGRLAGLDRFDNPFVRSGWPVRPLVSLEEHPGVLQSGGTVRPGGDQPFELRTFGFGEHDGIALDSYGQGSFNVARRRTTETPRYQRQRYPSIEPSQTTRSCLRTPKNERVGGA